MKDDMDDPTAAPSGLELATPKPFRPGWLVWYAKARSGLWRHLKTKGALIGSMPTGELAAMSIEMLAYCVACSKPFYAVGPYPKEPMTPFSTLEAMQDIYNAQNSKFIQNSCPWDELFESLSSWDRKQLAKTIPIELRGAKLITVYRGVYGQDNINGFSWTTDKRIAEAWAGFKKGFVVRGTVALEHVVFCGLENPPLSSHHGDDVIIWPRGCVTVSVP